MAWTVYEHITPSGKRYIGITSRENPNRRWRGGSHYYKGTAFRCAIDKYGWDSIQHNILFDDLTEKEAKWLENYLICYYRTFVGFKDSKGYNMTLGGEGSVGCTPWNKGIPRDDETKRKISESHKGKTSWNKGKHFSHETCKKISESKKGKPSPMKGKKTGKPAWNRGKKMKPLSEETRRKKSEAMKGKHWKLIDGKRFYYE